MRFQATALITTISDLTMHPTKTSPDRRRFLQQTSAVAACVAAPAWAQPGKAGAAARSVTVAQLIDVSLAQQDVSKDFLIGSRAAWQDINLRGGIRGRRVEHLSIETDGTPASLGAALDSVKNNPACIVMSGSAGDQIASQIVTLARQENLNLAHVAPWLQNSSLEVDDNTFPIFAARQEQIAYALKSLSVMGLSEIGAVFGSARDYAAYSAEVQRIAGSMQLKLQAFQGQGELRTLGQKLTSKTPAVLLFVGGTPELAEFTQGLEKQARQRYVVALADVNLQVMQQMGAGRNTPVIATQPVPIVTAGIAVVRHYRETLSRLFDEPPTSLSLAGFIAARYTYEVLNGIEGALTRPTVLKAFQKRASLDMGGFRVSFDNQRRSGSYVTQSMMTLDGRVIG
jgi:ABC-type branched-subunit amino acid transport system substrate-binding protein